MKKNIKGIYIFEIALFISVVIFNILKVAYSYNIILILSAIFCYMRFGYMKDNTYEKSNIIRIVIASVMAFTIIIYSLGVFTGFFRLTMNMSFIISTIITTLSIIAGEIIRYIIAKNSLKSKKPIIIFTILFIILNIVTQINGVNLNDRWRLFVFVSTIVLTTIARDLMCTYLAYNCSSVPNILYRLLTEVIIHCLPIIPDLGEYLYAIVRIVMPAVIFYFSTRIFRYHEKSGIYTKKTARRIIIIPLLLVAVLMVYLSSGLFKYKMIAIGSGSMEPEYYLGDAVIFEKKEADEVQVGEILVFKEGHTVVTHRIVSIDRRGNDFDIITKGDNNNKQDDYVVQKEDVLGVVRYTVKYIGYPTLWINKLIER